MKNKKLIAIILCLTMMFTLIHPAFAEAVGGAVADITTGSQYEYVPSEKDTEKNADKQLNFGSNAETTTSSSIIYQNLMGATSLPELYDMIMAANANGELDSLSNDEAYSISELIAELYTDEYEDLEIELMELLMIKFPEAFNLPVPLANNVHNVTQNKWYGTLSAATAAASDGNIIEVHNSFTETTSVKIQKQNLTIRAAAGKNPTISWTDTDSVAVSGATSYHCVVIYTSVTTATTFGGGTGTLTFDASRASDNDNKGTRARVMMHCGEGTLNIMDGIVLTGGNTGGGNYTDGKDFGRFPDFSGEIVGQVGFGAGIYMYNGTLNMSGGIIKDNYSLWGATAADRITSHNYVGGGGGVYLHKGTMNMTGGTITHNAAGSGGGAGILVGHGATLNVSGGTISENVCNFASGGGIGVRTNSMVKITGGLIKDNVVEGHGGGLFARGDSIPLEITGGTFEGNTANGYGGGVLFWTVGDDETKNTVKIGGNVQIINNTALDGGGVSVGREVLDGVPIGNKAKLIIEGNPVISGNTATNNGGGIHMQSDVYSDAVNTVEISGGTIINNEAKNGAGIYVPGGIVTMTGGTFSENEASANGAGIFTGGGTMTITDTTFSKNVAENFGGGAYVVGGSIIMNSGTFEKNQASNGGAVYITKEGTEKDSNFTMNDGTFSENIATENGGAVYVNGGDITMSGGSMKKNGAANGGAAYITGGNMTIHHGSIDNNTANLGGAVYMAGNANTLFTMESGTMIGNKATDNPSTANVVEGDGGAIYATGGTIKIGLESCKNETEEEVESCSHHTALGDGRHHPQINGNEAADTGGGIAIANEGVVHFYCGTANGNEALYKGVGKNVFMDGGEFHLYDGANVGIPRDPDLVIVGGELYNECVNKEYITLNYYYQNSDTATQMVGLAEYEEVMNLPDGEYFWDAPYGYTFLGWTAKGAASGDQNAVRNKEDYVNSGDPVQILDHKFNGDRDKFGETAENTDRMFDGDDTDKIIHLYALWVPVQSTISYKDRITGENIENEPTVYNFNRDSNILNIQSVIKAGYELVGWFIYQNTGQNANWNETSADKAYEPYSPLDYSKLKHHVLTTPNSILQLEAGNTNFGNITLIADWNAIIEYKAVVPAKSDSACSLKMDNVLSSEHSESVHVFDGSVKGAQPVIDETLTDYYVFVGWYKDADCQTAVTTTDGTINPADNSFTPAPIDDKYVPATYYAKFERIAADVEITKTLDQASDEDQNFIFTITGKDKNGNDVNMQLNITVPAGQEENSIKIAALPLGNYTIAEKDWGWRYVLKSILERSSLNINGTNATYYWTLVNEFETDKWLSSEVIAENIFKAVGTVVK